MLNELRRLVSTVDDFETAVYICHQQEVYSRSRWAENENSSYSSLRVGPIGDEIQYILMIWLYLKVNPAPKMNWHW